MYLAVRDVVAFQAGYESMVGCLRDLGLDAVELAFSRDRSVLDPAAPFHGARHRVLSPEDAEAYAALCGRSQLRAAALMVASNLNAERGEVEVSWVADAMRVAGPLGADVVRIDAAMTGQKEMPLRRRVEVFAAAVIRILEAAEDSAAVLAVETHGIQGTDPEWLQGVLDAVASPRLAVALDPANYYLAGHPLDQVYELAARFAPRVVHTHCKNLSFEAASRNAPRRPGWGYGEHVCPIAEGDLDYHRIAHILQDAGYCGALCLEEEGLGKFDDASRRAVLRRDVQHLRAVVNALEPATDSPA